MNEQTTKLITDLASKLGTTTEYLWGVLIKQALYSVITDLAFLIFSVIYGFVLYKVYKWLCEPVDEGGRYTRFDEHEDNAVMLFAIASIIFIVFLISILASCSNTKSLYVKLIHLPSDFHECECVPPLNAPFVYGEKIFRASIKIGFSSRFRSTETPVRLVAE